MSKKEKINYDDYTLDPAKDVLVPMQTYMVIHNIVKEMERQHSKVITTDKYAFYDKKTHKKLSEKGRRKLSAEDLKERYYENLDIEATEKNVRMDREPVGLAAFKMLAEFRGVFRHNVDKGNGVLKQKAPEAQELTRPSDELTK